MVPMSRKNSEPPAVEGIAAGRVRIRRAAARDLPRLVAWRAEAPIPWADEATFRARLADGTYRPAWTWIAEEGGRSGRIRGRAVWWGRPGADVPSELDCVLVDGELGEAARVEVAARLIAEGVGAVIAAGGEPSAQLLLPPGWRDDAAVAAAVAWRCAAAARAGLAEVVERVRWRWTPDVGLPARSERLVFVACDDDNVVAELLARVAEGSLDTQTRRRVARVGAAACGRQELAIYAGLAGRARWRIAATADREVVGLVLPGANDGGPILGFVGVVPAARGRGYAHDLIAEGTAMLAADGAPRVVSDTDAGNPPICEAFARAGYRACAARLTLLPA
jgi:ribosomal protein S18 acetylase RimI-like enzyme